MIAKLFRSVIQCPNNWRLRRNCAQMKYSVFLIFNVNLSRQLFSLSIIVSKTICVIQKQNYKLFPCSSNVIVFLFPNCKDGFAHDYIYENIFFYLPLSFCQLKPNLINRMSISFSEGTKQQNPLCRPLIKILFQYTIYLFYDINPKEYSRFKLSLV